MPSAADPPMQRPTAPPSSELLDSANQIHASALRSFRLGNQGRLTLCQALHALKETRQYFQLGFPSIAAYALAHFEMERSETFECVRVAKVLDELTACKAAFCDGSISWSTLKAITRVASSESEDEWLRFSREHGPARLRAEARDAARKNRTRPREKDHGLPNLDVDLVVRLTRTEHERLLRGLERVVPEISARLGGQGLEVKDVLLYLAEWMLETERDPSGPSPLAQRRPSADSPQALLYQRCTDCGKGRLFTEEGWVEVSTEELDRVEGNARTESLEDDGSATTTRSFSESEAESETEADTARTLTGPTADLDPPTPPAMRRRILLRDGGRCTNPHCQHAADHCHHIVFRSEGGRTALWNETAVCSICHALIHAGLLVVEGRPGEDLRWIPRAGGAAMPQPSWQPDARLPEIRVFTHASPTHEARSSAPRPPFAPERYPTSSRARGLRDRRDAPGGGRGPVESPEAWGPTTGQSDRSAHDREPGLEESADADWMRLHGEALVGGLVRLGLRSGEARRRLSQALENVSGDRTREAVLRSALAATG